MERLPTTGIA